jgi:hypothetical protein
VAGTRRHKTGTTAVEGARQTMNPRLARYLGKLDVPQDYLVREFVETYEEGAMGRRDLL